MKPTFPEPAIRAFVVLAAMAAAFILLRRAHGAPGVGERYRDDCPSSVVSPAKHERSAMGAASAAGASRGTQL